MIWQVKTCLKRKTKARLVLSWKNNVWFCHCWLLWVRWFKCIKHNSIINWNIWNVQITIIVQYLTDYIRMICIFSSLCDGKTVWKQQRSINYEDECQWQIREKMCLPVPICYNLCHQKESSSVNFLQLITPQHGPLWLHRPRREIILSGKKKKKKCTWYLGGKLKYHILRLY